MNFPETAFILNENDICKRTTGEGDHTAKHCLRGWANLWLTGKPGCWSWGDPRHEMIQEEIMSAGRELGARAVDLDDVAEVNDNPRNSRRLLARIWNKAMLALGYTVGNPEARKKAA